MFSYFGQAKSGIHSLANILTSGRGSHRAEHWMSIPFFKILDRFRVTEILFSVIILEKKLLSGEKRENLEKRRKFGEIFEQILVLRRRKVTLG